MKVNAVLEDFFFKFKYDKDVLDNTDWLSTKTKYG